MSLFQIWWPLGCDLDIYYPCKALGWFFHWQCMQSTDLSILGTPLDASIANNFFVSSTIGSLRYSGPNTFTTVRANFVVAWWHVLYLIPISASAGLPCASILRAVMHFYKWAKAKDSCSQQSFLGLKYGSYSTMAFTMCKNKCLLIRKRCRKKTSWYVGSSLK